MSFSNPSTDEIRDLLRAARTIAVIGYSPDADRPSHSIAHSLARAGYRVIAVRPQLASAFDGPAYAQLCDIPNAAATVDIVDVFRAPQHVRAIVDECIALGMRTLWLQDGVVDEVSAQRAHAAGITVIMDRCIGRDYRMLVA